MEKENEIPSLITIYEEFGCSSKAMKDYLDKRILITGYNLTEQDKIEHLYETRDACIDGFMVAEWDAFLDACEYFEGKKNEKK